MFNFHQFKKAQNIESIPGSDIEQKAEYLGSQISQISKKPDEVKFPELEKFNTSVDELRTYALGLISSQPGNDVNEKIQTIITDLQNRLDNEFVPALAKLRSQKSRPKTDVAPLTEYRSEDERRAIVNFINQEIDSTRRQCYGYFLDAKKEINEQFPNITDYILKQLVISGKTAISSHISPETNLEALSFANRKLNEVNIWIKGMQGNQRPWNRILSLHPEIKEFTDYEYWESLAFTPIVFNLEEIVKFFDPQFGEEINYNKLPKTEDGKSIISTQSTDELYAYFYRENDDNGNPLSSEQQEKKAIDLLSSLIVESDYDSPEGIRAIIGTSLLADDISGFDLEERRFNNGGWFFVNSSANKIQYFFKSSRICSNNVRKFQEKLRSSEDDRIKILADALEIKDGIRQYPDTRYRELKLKFLSKAERDIVEKLREGFGLDAIPFPVSIPIPSDCPTNKIQFVIDFVLCCDVLIDIDEDTQEPIYKSQVIFIGEYYGVDNTTPMMIQDAGVPWVKPDGSTPIYKDKNSKNEYTVEAGKKTAIKAYYNLKSEWKDFTYRCIGDMIGTSALSLNENDLNTEETLMAKLDNLNIIYNSRFCGSDKYKGCKAFYRLREEAPNSELYRKYADSQLRAENFDGLKSRSARVIDCAILRIQMDGALNSLKQDYAMSDPYNEIGFNRQTLYSHIEYMNKLAETEARVERRYQRYRSDADHEALKWFRQESQLMENSPIYELKVKMQEKMKTGEIAQKLQSLEQLKQMIISGAISPSLSELNSMLTEIHNGFNGYILAEYEPGA
jgi:hypothetical protein